MPKHHKESVKAESAVIIVDARARRSDMERRVSMIVLTAIVEVSFVFAGVVAFIWRQQFTFPDFAIVLLAFIVATFFVHRARLVILCGPAHLSRARGRAALKWRTNLNRFATNGG